jgi:ubiquinone/menaquinone biosynthesis C-methylase UbiE
VLIGKACLSAPVQRVLDVGAGTGRTAEAALGVLGPGTRVICVEPSPAMRRAGKARLKDSRVRWQPALPARRGSFDRILCGAAIWQMTPLAETLARFAALLREGGALCFNIPGL